MDHHRLIWQLGVVPLIYYLYGENVIIEVREDPHAGSEQLNQLSLKTHQPVARRMYVIIENFRAGLEITMAVTGARWRQAETCIGLSHLRLEPDLLPSLGRCNFGPLAGRGWNRLRDCSQPLVSPTSSEALL